MVHREAIKDVVSYQQFFYPIRKLVLGPPRKHTNITPTRV